MLKPIQTLAKPDIQTLAEQIIDLQYAHQAEIWEPYGQAGREKSIRDTGYHLT